MSNREYPNILFLMTDEHRPDLAGFAGNSIVRTPNLDRLAKDSVVFNHAYTPSPVCIPARQCIMSGQFPRTCGCEVFGDDLPPFYRTFARTFSEKRLQHGLLWKTSSHRSGSNAGMAAPDRQ